MKSFKKNFLTVGLAIALVLAGSWLVGVPQHKLVDGMTLVIATMVMTLILEDFWRKALTDKERLTWQYFVGMAIMSLAVLAWLWASESYTNKEMIVRLIATFLSSSVGAWWMAVPYRRSISTGQDEAERKAIKYQKQEAKRWARWAKKAKAASYEEALDILRDHLRFHILGNTLEGDLDFTSPLMIVSEEVLTYREAMDQELELDIVRYADEYIMTLLQDKL